MHINVYIYTHTQNSIQNSTLLYRRQEAALYGLTPVELSEAEARGVFLKELLNSLYRALFSPKQFPGGGKIPAHPRPRQPSAAHPRRANRPPTPSAQKAGQRATRGQARAPNKGADVSHLHPRPVLEGSRTWGLRRQTEMIKPLAFTNGHGRYISVTPERTLASVEECPLNM
jgi:hypothetical protein